MRHQSLAQQIMIFSPDYVSFMVRMWRESSKDGDWVAQVEHIPTGETKYFSSLDELFEYLRDRYAQDQAPVRQK